MKRLPVKSSTLKSVGYDIQKRKLEVEFLKGSIYEYECVDYVDVLGIIFSESSGSYFAKNVATRYEYKKIGE